ncbi:MAG: Grx4 family monothiol glutaredoxin [Myxococcota bacterium]
MAMNPADPAHQQIDSVVKANPIVLFMKGTRTQPQCGFSASVVSVLDELGPTYETVNVLADPAIRDGIKSYGDWPTIPQLYVKGELVGGADIVKSLYASGELNKMLGVPVEEVKPPSVRITDWAAEVLREAAKKEKHQALRIEVSPRFQYGLLFSEDRPGDLIVESNGFTILVDRGSAKRADGLVLDYSKEQKGFRIENPNEPPKVQPITPKQLKQAQDENPRLRLYDVRTPEERQTAMIPGSKLWTPTLREEVMQLPKDTPLYFHCHHGGRSQNLAQVFLDAGFTKVFNLHGGIDAWSRDIDNTVPRY